MGPVVTLIATKIAGAFFGGSIWAAWAIETAIYYFAGRYLYRRAQGPRPEQPQLPLNTRLQYLREPNAPHRIVYGEAVFAPTIVADFSDDENLYVLMAISPHAIEDILDIRVNDQDFFTAAEVASLNSSPDPGGEALPRMVVPDNGTANDDISELRKRVAAASRENGNPIMGLTCDKSAQNPGKFERASTTSWENITPAIERFTPFFFGRNGKGQGPKSLEMKMSGMSWLAMVLPRSNRAVDPADTDADVWSSVPVLTLKVRRSNDTLRLPAGFDRTPYSRGNSALCAYDYLARYTDYAESVFGIERIDASNLVAAANFCEARGLTCNGMIQLDQSPADVMEQLGLAMNSGVFTEVAGIRKIIPGAPGTAVRTITDDEILKGSWGYSPLTDINSRVSEVVCRYVDADGVEQSEGASYRDSEISASQEVQLDLINNRKQAGQVARILLSRIWNGAALTLTLVDGELPIRPYDKIRVEGCGALLLNDEFRVLKAERTTDGTLSLQCLFEADDLFDEHELDGTYIPPATLPNYIGAPGGTYRISLNDGADRLIVRRAGDSEDSHLSYR